MLWWVFFFSRTTGTLGAKGDWGGDVSRWPLRIADRVGWNTGQELRPEDSAHHVQPDDGEQLTGSHVLLKIIELKMTRDKDLNPGEYFVFG